MFKVTWVNYGELDFSSSDFCELTYDVSEHLIFYKTCNGTRHSLRCDFGSIFDKIHSIVSSDEFQNEKPYEDGCDGDWYKFEYTLNGVEIKYEGYIYGLKYHEEVVSLIKSCAKDTLEDERKLLGHKCADNEVENIIRQRQELEKDFLDFWEDISSTIQKIPDGFIKCDNCKSIIHNKYYKNRKYFGKDLVSDVFGDYEVEYDEGECPVCGALNTELPYTGIDFQPDDSLFSSDGAVCITAFEEDKDKLYSVSELNDLLKHISEDDRKKIIDCQFKLFETSLDDDSGDVYYYITIFKEDNEIGKLEMKYASGYDYRMVLHEDLLKHLSDDDRVKVSNCQFKLSVTFPDAGVGDIFYDLTVYKDGNEIGKIDMQYHSNIYFDLMDMEIKTTDDTPYYTYEMILYEDSNKDGFGILGKWSPFDDSKFRCKKCGKVFCSCNKSFTRRGY